MNIIKSALPILLLAGAMPAFATAVVIGFDGIATGKDTVDASKQSFADGLVHIGPTSTSTAPLIANSAKYGGAGSFYGSYLDSVPANQSAMLMQGGSFLITVDGGFFGNFSIDFAGQGTVHLAAITATETIEYGSVDNDNSLCDTPYACTWKRLSFDESPEKVLAIEVFGTTGTALWFDQISFANLDVDEPPTGLPEPGGVALSVAALGALAWTRRRAGSKRG